MHLNKPLSGYGALLFRKERSPWILEHEVLDAQAKVLFATKVEFGETLRRLARSQETISRPFTTMFPKHREEAPCSIGRLQLQRCIVNGVHLLIEAVKQFLSHEASPL